MNPRRRGEIYWLAFDPTVGAEIQKTRPAVVIQNDWSNRSSPVTVVAALTSKFEKPLYPTEVFVRPHEGGLSIPSVVLLNQIRSVDRKRLVRKLGKLRPETMRKVDSALKISLGLAGL